MDASRKVLVIDDDEDFLDYVSIILTSAGYAVQTESSAAQGLDAIRSNPPALVISDVMMSYVLDGWSIHQAMLEDPALCEIPVMMVSAIVSLEDTDLFPLSAQNKIAAFMSKPLDPKALIAQVQALIPETLGG